MWIKFIKNTEYNKIGDVVDVGEELAEGYLKKKLAESYEFSTVAEETPAPKIESFGPAIVDAEIVNE